MFPQAIQGMIPEDRARSKPWVCNSPTKQNKTLLVDFKWVSCSIHLLVNCLGTGSVSSLLLLITLLSNEELICSLLREINPAVLGFQRSLQVTIISKIQAWGFGVEPGIMLLFTPNSVPPGVPPGMTTKAIPRGVVRAVLGRIKVDLEAFGHARHVLHLLWAVFRKVSFKLSFREIIFPIIL